MTETAGLTQGPRFKRLFETWKSTHEAQGGDRNIAVELHSGDDSLSQHTKGGAMPAAGSAQLDVIDGRVEVRVSRLPEGKSYDVWLVDQRPAPGGSSSVEASDAFINAGTLQPVEGGFELHAALGPNAFAAFQVDSVVVAEAGSDPAKTGLYRGGPDLFQSLYTSLRTPELYALSDFLAPNAFPSRGGQPLVGGVAYAQDLMLERNFGVNQAQRRQLVNVDADEVLNELVREGARLFITEQFDGNGRTCETCHNFLNDITLSKNDVDLRSDTDALFVSEFMPALAPQSGANGMIFPLDNPMGPRNARPCVREDGLDLNIPPVCRSVPHLQAFSTSRTPSSPAVAPQGAPGVPPYGAFFPGGMMIAPTPGTMVGALNSTVIGDAKGRLGVAPDDTFTIGIRGGWGGDLGQEPGLNLFGDDTGIVVGAVALLFTKSGNRMPGMDFRIPTPAEINAITAFYLTLGRQQDVDLRNVRFSDPGAERGRQIFLNDGTDGPVMDAAGQPVAMGKCTVCHDAMTSKSKVKLFNNICLGLSAALQLDLDGDGMTAPADQDDVPICGGTQFNFATGVNDTNDIADMQSMQAFGQKLPRDGGFGRVPHMPGVCNKPAAGGGFGSIVGIDFPGTDVLAGDCTESFNPPVLVEAADTGPFFHNNTATTLEAAIEFYNSEPFIKSGGGRILNSITPQPLMARPDIPIRLDAGEVQQIGMALRAANARFASLPNAADLINASLRNGVNRQTRVQLLRVARSEVLDAQEVLLGGQINAPAAQLLLSASDQLRRQTDGGDINNNTVRAALQNINQAMAMIATTVTAPAPMN